MPQQGPVVGGFRGGRNDTSSSSQAAECFKFITGFRGTKVLVFDGYLYHINSKMKKTVYFKCSEKRKGCMAGVTMKNFNPKDCSFDSFVITNNTHVNHLPNPEKIHRRVEIKEGGEEAPERQRVREGKRKEKSSAVRKASHHVCLFCLTHLPPEYMEVTMLENVLPCGQLLSVTLDDPVKNSKAFELLCTLLYVRWRRTQEGQKFDQRKALPLCNQCQNLYQELCQIHQQIRELEGVLNSRVKAVRDTIDKTEKTKRPKIEMEKTQLVPLGLDVFRKRVVELASIPSIHNVPMLTTLGFRPKLSQAGLEVEPSMPVPDVEKIPLESSRDDVALPFFVKQEVEVDEALNTLQEEQDSQYWGEDNPNVGTVSKGPTNLEEPNNQESQKQNRRRLEVEDKSEYFPTIAEDSRDNDFDLVKGTLGIDDNDCELIVNQTRFQRDQRGRGRPPRILRKGRARLGVASRRTSYQPKKVHECHICSVKVTGYTAFMSHYSTEHPEERRYSCKFCKKHFVYIGGCLAHQRRHTGERPFKCAQCSKSFFDNLGLYHHRRYEHSGHKLEKIPCPHCPRVCTSQVSFKSHLNRHSDQVLICKAPNCSKPFRNMATFLKHNRLYHNGEAESSTPISNPTKETLESLGVTTEIKWRVRCHLCDAPIHGSCFVRKHFESCHAEHLVTGSENTCRCGKQFKTYRECCIHVFRVHSGAEKAFQCEHCPQKFLTGVELHIHRSTHLPMEERHKNHICDVCGLSLASRHTMYAHMKIHTEANQSHVCEFCGKEFRLKRCLMQHKRSQHLKILPYKCHYEGCNKAFPVPSVLQKHLNAHSEDKSIKCQSCDKSFNYSNSLSRHMREVHNTAGDEGQTPRKKKAKKKMTGTGSRHTRIANYNRKPDPTSSSTCQAGFSESPHLLLPQHIPVIQVNYANSVGNQPSYHHPPPQSRSIYQLNTRGTGNYDGGHEGVVKSKQEGWQSPSNTGGDSNNSNSHSGY